MKITKILTLLENIKNDIYHFKNYKQDLTKEEYKKELNERKYMYKIFKLKLSIFDRQESIFNNSKFIKKVEKELQELIELKQFKTLIRIEQLIKLINKNKEQRKESIKELKEELEKIDIIMKTNLTKELYQQMKKELLLK
jgi:hypothetical protein